MNNLSIAVLIFMAAVIFLVLLTQPWKTDTEHHIKQKK